MFYDYLFISYNILYIKYICHIKSFKFYKLSGAWRDLLCELLELYSK